MRDRIEWFGQMPNSAVMDLRRRSLVSVVASRYDNFPTTVTEAMAMGCPIVAPATGGIVEQIKHEVSGRADQIGRPGRCPAGELERRAVDLANRDRSAPGPIRDDDR